MNFLLQGIIVLCQLIVVGMFIKGAVYFWSSFWSSKRGDYNQLIAVSACLIAAIKLIEDMMAQLSSS